MGIRCADHVTPLYPQKLALISPTGGGRSVCIFRSRTKATEFFWCIFIILLCQVLVRPTIVYQYITAEKKCLLISVKLLAIQCSERPCSFCPWADSYGETDRSVFQLLICCWPCILVTINFRFQLNVQYFISIVMFLYMFRAPRHGNQYVNI